MAINTVRCVLFPPLRCATYPLLFCAIEHHSGHWPGTSGTYEVANTVCWTRVDPLQKKGSHRPIVIRSIFMVPIGVVHHLHLARNILYAETRSALDHIASTL